MMNIPSECRSANIVRDHAVILSDDAIPKPDEIFGKDRLHSIRTNKRPIAIIWRSCSDSSGTAGQMDRVFGSDRGPLMRFVFARRSWSI